MQDLFGTRLKICKISWKLAGFIMKDHLPWNGNPMFILYLEQKPDSHWLKGRWASARIHLLFLKFISFHWIPFPFPEFTSFFLNSPPFSWIHLPFPKITSTIVWNKIVIQCNVSEIDGNDLRGELKSPLGGFHTEFTSIALDNLYLRNQSWIGVFGRFRPGNCEKIINHEAKGLNFYSYEVWTDQTWQNDLFLF